MYEQRRAQESKARNLNPEFLNYLLNPRLNRLPEPSPDDPAHIINTDYMYDGVLLNRILASIPLTGLEIPSTKKGVYDLRKIVDQIAVKRDELAFGNGAEGTVREIFTPKDFKDDPFSSPTARFENPGEIWVETAEHIFIGTPYQAEDKITAYGLVPLEDALKKIDDERQRKQLTPDIPTQFEVMGIRILPGIMVDYTNALQRASRESAFRGEPLDVESFRVKYFHLDPANPEALTGIFRQIKQEYLGNTTWSTILKLQLTLRVYDYIKGFIPIGGSILDFMQAYTGKELPLPGAERFIRHKLREKNTPVPGGMFDKPIKSRLIELADALLGIAPLIVPPAWLAKIPADVLIEGLLYLDQLHYTTGKYLPPFMEIAKDTGTTPKIITKVAEARKATPTVISGVWNRIKTVKPPKDIFKGKK